MQHSRSNQQAGPVRLARVRSWWNTKKKAAFDSSFFFDFSRSSNLKFCFSSFSSWLPIYPAVNKRSFLKSKRQSVLDWRPKGFLFWIHRQSTAARRILLNGSLLNWSALPACADGHWPFHWPFDSLATGTLWSPQPNVRLPQTVNMFAVCGWHLICTVCWAFVFLISFLVFSPRVQSSNLTVSGKGVDVAVLPRFLPRFLHRFHLKIA